MSKCNNSFWCMCILIHFYLIKFYLYVYLYTHLNVLGSLMHIQYYPWYPYHPCCPNTQSQYPQIMTHNRLFLFRIETNRNEIKIMSDNFFPNEVLLFNQSWLNYFRLTCCILVHSIILLTLHVPSKLVLLYDVIFFQETRCVYWNIYFDDQGACLILSILYMMCIFSINVRTCDLRITAHMYKIYILNIWQNYFKSVTVSN